MPERGERKFVVKMAQIASVESLVDCFDIQFETETLPSVEFNQVLKNQGAIDLTSRRLVACCGSRGWHYILKPVWRAVARHAYYPVAWH